jgi:hypothetical protein
MVKTMIEIEVDKSITGTLRAKLIDVATYSLYKWEMFLITKELTVDIQLLYRPNEVIVEGTIKTDTVGFTSKYKHFKYTLGLSNIDEILVKPGSKLCVYSEDKVNIFIERLVDSDTLYAVIEYKVNLFLHKVPVEEGFIYYFHSKDFIDLVNSYLFEMKEDCSSFNKELISVPYDSHHAEFNDNHFIVPNGLVNVYEKVIGSNNLYKLTQYLKAKRFIKHSNRCFTSHIYLIKPQENLINNWMNCLDNTEFTYVLDTIKRCIYNPLLNKRCDFKISNPEESDPNDYLYFIPTTS